MDEVNTVKTTRFTEDFASAASKIALFPVTACDTRSPGAVASGDAI